MQIRDRIVGFKRVKASELKRNPRNFRIHSSGQREMMRGILQEVGYVDALIARETPDGGYELIDGEMRSEITPDMEVPVVLVDLDEDEVAKVLATFDPITALAKQDDAKLSALVRGIETNNADVRRLLTDLDPEGGSGGIGEQDAEGEESMEGGDPNMALQPHEHYDYLVVLCTSTHEWNVLCDRLQLKPEKRRSRMGTGRGIRAGVLLEYMAKLAEGSIVADRAKDKA